MRHTRSVVNGEEPSAFDAVPLRRATPHESDRAGSAASAGPATNAPQDDPARSAGSGDEPASSTPAGDQPTRDEPGSHAPGSDPAAGGGPAAAPGQHWRTLIGRGAQALRRVPPPHRAAAAAVHGTAEWARRPHGRLALMGLFIAALLALTGAAGAYLVPAGRPVDTPRPAAQNSAAPQDTGAVPSTTASAPTTVPSAGPEVTASSVPFPSSSPGNPVGAAGARPATALNGWAQHMASLVDVPLVALEAYGYAELVVAQTTSGCHLSWTTLAAIGKVESNHGSFKGSTLYPDGQALPSIIGPPLDGKDGRQPIADTDFGQLDNDTRWDHAVGPMQFIPSTWRSQAVDADNDGIRNPHDIDDAALAAANYLCSNGRNLATPQGWWDAIAAYNVPRSYGELVFQAANDYGTQSLG
jgi:membrane-bound lytic murein transglycosylase B